MVKCQIRDKALLKNCCATFGTQRLIEDSSIRNEKARVAEKELRRNMYHNTQVMLKNYRDIVWALECFPGEIAQELEQPLKDVDALLSAVDAQIAMGNANWSTACSASVSHGCFWTESTKR